MSDLLTQTRTITVDRAAMLEGLSAVSGAIPKSTPKPILLNVLLEVGYGKALLLATDLEIGIRHRIEGVVADDGPGEDARVVLPAERIRSILADAEGDTTIRLEFEGGPGEKPTHLLVRGAKFKHRLPLQDDALFPAVADFGDDVADYASVEARDFRKAIRRCIFATDEATSRYALGGCLFEFGPDGLLVVATDGRRLSRQVVTVETEGDGYPKRVEGGPLGPVVPTKTLRLVQRVTSDEDFPIHLAPAPPPDQGMLIRTERSVIHTRLVEGRYPQWRQIIPPAHSTKVSVTVGPLLLGVRQAENATSVESRTVDFEFSGDTLTMRAKTADVGSGEAEVPIVSEGRPVTVGMDSRYVGDVLKVLEPGESVRIGAGNPGEGKDHKLSVVLETDDGFTHAIMPLTPPEEIQT